MIEYSKSDKPSEYTYTFLPIYLPTYLPICSLEYTWKNLKLITYAVIVWEAAAEAQTKARADWIRKQDEERNLAARMKDEIRASVQGGGSR